MQGNALHSDWHNGQLPMQPTSQPVFPQPLPGHNARYTDTTPSAQQNPAMGQALDVARMNRAFAPDPRSSGMQGVTSAAQLVGSGLLTPLGAGMTKAMYGPQRDVMEEIIGAFIAGPPMAAMTGFSGLLGLDGLNNLPASSQRFDQFAQPDSVIHPNNMASYGMNNGDQMP